ncbi:hypothetical protein Taro_054733 [Colocasia esculenta]|uniref:Uncharacterized protein n=1 Tax=Colocasia esculenta TaxID=4460 RepID=A0A843XRJ6_COLES|nr:hypothetical protein [Colocasia esculenta]
MCFGCFQLPFGVACVGQLSLVPITEQFNPLAAWFKGRPASQNSCPALLLRRIPLVAFGVPLPLTPISPLCARDARRFTEGQCEDHTFKN